MTYEEFWEPYPSRGEIETAFSELLAIIERIRKYQQPGDTALLMLERDILSFLRALKIDAEQALNEWTSALPES